VRADLDAFLGLYADRYFGVVAGAARAAAPRHLVFSPAMLNGHKGLTRREILRAAGRHCDVIEINHNVERPDLLGITYRETGGRPLMSWMGITANPDSAMRGQDFALGSTLRSQAERGARYEHDVLAMLDGRVDDGSRAVVGVLWWEYMDKWGEKANWGLVSPRNNPYDGRAAVRALGRDEWGYTTGGEDQDYGDFISHVRRVNAGVDARLVSDLRAGRDGK
jgi:agarase